MWVTGTTLIDWNSAVAFRLSCASAGSRANTHAQTNTDTHTHLHSWYCGCVCEGEACVRCWSRTASGHQSSSTSPDKDKAWRVREQQHTPSNGSPQLLICLWCLWLSWLCADWSTLSRLCVTMNGFASVVYLLMTFGMSSNLHSSFYFQCQTYKRLALVSKVDSNLF